MKKKRVSIKDVAREAGVSIATISYVLNNKKGESISDETINRVREAIKKLNYVPNLSARSLVSKRSNLIGVVIPQAEAGKEFMFYNPFYGEFLSSVEYEARKKGFHLLISGTEADQKYIQVAQNRGLDGIIIVGIYPDSFFQELKQCQIPIVLVDSYCSDHYFHSIGINDRHGGYLATKHLIEKGHRKIAFISGMVKENGVNSNRLLGYKDALEEYGIDFDEKLLYLGDTNFEYGIKAGARLANSKNGETAAFATADILAVGVIKGLKENGLRVPEDKSVVGFDDVYLARITDPSLTTVRQNIAEKGRQAAEIIIQTIENEIKEKRDIILPVDIVERDSVKDIN